MKKIILTINDFDYERFKFEAILEGKSVPELIKTRIFLKEFSQIVTTAFDEKIERDLNALLKD